MDASLREVAAQRNLYCYVRRIRSFASVKKHRSLKTVVPASRGGRDGVLRFRISLSTSDSCVIRVK